MKKILISVIAFILTCCCCVGVTYAWLVDKTAPITTTFTAGNINISLREPAATTQKMVPGGVITESPEVTVYANSEDCWLFVKVEKSQGFDTYLSYQIADGWTALADEGDNETTIYYREVAFNKDANQVFKILRNDEIVVKPEPTKAQYDAMSQANYPTLTITAYAVQKVGFETPAAAWEEAARLT